ncbi:GNAT family N-acetyltransferase [Cochlodiniinecator piscidefendens]|uniref:GNAT family N-acetyltransferase n=1 Tax=Cochlodiniinecator piscidefendens TaxID=2715756 RepID=UPI00140802F9|nr:GNAT family N-acetyltransferase [Cochlodiniinecator piscidefendens]
MTPQQLAYIHAKCFTTPRPWTAQEFDDLLQNRFTFLVPSEHGFALGRSVAGEAELLTIAVLPRYRNTGIGSFLLTSFETKARLRESQEAFLEVSDDNFPAITLYQRANYKENGARQNYYKAPDGTAKTALLFRKFLI